MKQGIETILTQLRSKKNEKRVLRTFSKLNCVFIHIPKCGGISINESIFSGHKWGHRSYAYYESMFGDRISQMYSFTIVRHPVSRLYSAYTFLSNGGINDLDAQFSENVLSQFTSFEDFVINGLSRPDVQNWVHFKPQTSWLLSSSGTLDVSFIGYFENLVSDFSQICDDLALDKTLVHSNKTVQYSTFDHEGLDVKVINRIRDVYKLDFEMLYPNL